MKEPRTIGAASIETQDLYAYMSATAEPGKVWEYAELDGAAKTDARAKSCLQTARRMLMRDGVHTEAVRGVGIKVLNDEEAARSPQAAIRFIRNKARRTIRQTTFMEYDGLSNEGKLALDTHRTVLVLLQRATSVSMQKKIAGRVEESRSGRLPVKETLALFNGQSE